MRPGPIIFGVVGIAVLGGAVVYVIRDASSELGGHAQPLPARNEPARVAPAPAIYVPPPPPREKPIAVYAEKLARAYKENEVAADNQFAGHRIRVQGFIKDISKGFRGEPVVILKGAGFLENVRCRFPLDTPAASAIATFRRGNLVTFDCTVERKMIGSVMLDECEGLTLETLRAENPELLKAR